MARTVTVIQGENGGEPSFAYSERGDLAGGANYRAVQNDYVDDGQGNTRHIMADVELDEGAQPGSNFDYEATLIELHGGRQAYQAMTDYAKANWDHIDIQRFDDIMNGDDNASKEDELRHLAQMFHAHKGPSPASEELPEGNDEDFSEAENFFAELSDEFIGETVDHLLDNPIDENDASLMSELADSYDETTAENFILTCGQMVHAGELTMKEAIQDVIDVFGEADASFAYFKLQEQLNK